MTEFIDKTQAVVAVRFALTEGGSIAKRIREIPAADVIERPRWIPVEEGLPEFGEEVLAVRRFGDRQEVITAHIAVEKNGHSWWSAANITHWMLIPEPPKENANDQH